MSLTRDFNETAREYEAARRRLIPCFDEFYGAALGLLPFGPDAAPAILDLGAGTGLLAAMLREAWPQARLTLLDLAEAMLDQARTRFAGDARVSFEVGDLAGALPQGPFDAVVSALAIHHLPDAKKARLYGRIFGLLRPGGVFVNAEQVLGRTADSAAADRAWWRARIQANGATAPEIAQADQRMAHDQMAPVDAQLRWLDAAGFEAVDCVYKNHWFAVFGGTRPPGA